MGKIYNTKTKLLHTSHPHFKLEDRNLASDLAEDRTDDKKAHDKPKPEWNPINSKFFKDDDDDDQSDTEIESNTEEVLDDNPNNDLDSSQTSNDFQWDDSPEQYELDESHNPDIDQAIEPRRLFTDDDSPANDDLTSEDSRDDAVFNRDTFETPPTEPRLRRSNAMRTKERPIVENDPDSEPRVTRRMLSDPTSPYNLQLNQRQFLNNVLNPNAPLVPELVDLGPRVQNLQQALATAENNDARRSARIKPTVDYREINVWGKKH